MRSPAECKQDDTIAGRILVADCNKPYQLGAPGKSNAQQQRSRLFCVSSRANLAPSHAFGGGYDGFKNDNINRVRRMLVALGAGAALSSLVGALPQIVWLSEHKLPVFLGAGVMLALAGTL